MANQEQGLLSRRPLAAAPAPALRRRLAPPAAAAAAGPLRPRRLLVEAGPAALPPAPCPCAGGRRQRPRDHPHSSRARRHGPCRAQQTEQNPLAAASPGRALVPKLPIRPRPTSSGRWPAPQLRARRGLSHPPRSHFPSGATRSTHRRQPRGPDVCRHPRRPRGRDPSKAGRRGAARAAGARPAARAPRRRALHGVTSSKRSCFTGDCDEWCLGFRQGPSARSREGVWPHVSPCFLQLPGS